MRQRLTIILTFIVIIGLLVILNSITYVRQEKTEDLEVAPNRSTYHSGPTGTRALHDLLNESGHMVIRWRESNIKLLGESGKQVHTFVVIGRTQVEFTDEETRALRQWVSLGGRLVLIDRKIDSARAPLAANWAMRTKEFYFPTINDNPSDSAQMTSNVAALQPVQPTVLTSTVQSVMPSRFGTRLEIWQRSDEDVLRVISSAKDESAYDDDYEPPPATTPPPGQSQPAESISRAPVVHIADRSGALLVDYQYGMGRIVLLTDPYIVANGGIRLNDNLQLAINTLTARPGLIAFDEYHQGHVISQNAFASYFAGTPVLAIAAQIVLLILLMLWTNARRFGRPLPLPHVDRRSNLEFVASMAELQERSRAFDLAIENIYTRTRRVLARYAGVDYNSSRAEIATRIAERSTIDGERLETLMRGCEEAINGEPITWRQTLELIRGLREVEKDLGLRMRSRDVRQAAENI
jgi:hypothetical protein